MARGYTKVKKAAVAGAKKAKSGWKRLKLGSKIMVDNPKYAWKQIKRNVKRSVKGKEYHGVPGGRTKQPVRHHIRTTDPSKVGGRRR